MTIVSLEPVEGTNSVVGAALLREQKGETVLIGESGPPTSIVIVLCSLHTAVQHNNERAELSETGWNVCRALQRSRVGSNACYADEFFRNVRDGHASTIWGWRR
jgi:hypothetical protein